MIDGLLNSADFTDTKTPPGNDLATQTHIAASRVQGTSRVFDLEKIPTEKSENTDVNFPLNHCDC